MTRMNNADAARKIAEHLYCEVAWADLVDWPQGQHPECAGLDVWRTVLTPVIAALLDKLYPVPESLEAAVRGALSVLMDKYITKYNWSGYASPELEAELQAGMESIITEAVAPLLAEKEDRHAEAVRLLNEIRVGLIAQGRITCFISELDKPYFKLKAFLDRPENKAEQGGKG